MKKLNLNPCEISTMGLLISCIRDSNIAFGELYRNKTLAPPMPVKIIDIEPADKSYNVYDTVIRR